MPCAKDRSGKQNRKVWFGAKSLVDFSVQSGKRIDSMRPKKEKKPSEKKKNSCTILNVIYIYLNPFAG
ncbi:hypothetical protein LEP1GSC202_0020 [Leptospira yanagawae serovar Saopaulo str. Sao Paulo = ATCC 700523]|uniref:Uncharacterized protein n=1 Tax=Leptospira yanagawae serovar Saopaulo str. Sao Paulo = ATCC 700523 TaxID=1249483 RepID=A0A5E8HB70_9LEPT|nr:hypothetical protein LEP1GSC202_0020 [Leptospira yanagawae serovar Saopaulo str. Sao Paulo = ATCC 700523]